MKNKLFELALEAVTTKGAKYPTVAHSSDGKPVFVDTESGKCYEVIVSVKEIK